MSLPVRACVLGLFGAGLPVSALGVFPTLALMLGDDPALTSVRTEEGPFDLPGREPGPRERREAKPAPTPVPAPQAAPEAAPAPALRDWFGSRPIWEWSRLTGDWGGARTALEDAGLTFNASLRMDWQSVWSGGVRERASTKTLWNVNAALDLEKLVGLKGGTVYASFQSINGRGQGDSGALQVPSSLEVADSRDQIDELWYQQWLFDDFLRI